MKYYIGADLGTSALKLLLVAQNGEIIKTVSVEYPVSYPAPGWSEQAPADWFNAFTLGIKQLKEGFSGEIVAIGAGGQMHGLVVLDEADNVIRPAILWNDGRTQKQTDYLNNVIGTARLNEYTANIAFAGFTAPKLLWLKENEPESFNRISKIMLPKDYLNYRLTGIFATDFSDAAGTLLLDVKNKRWSQEMLDICGINKKMLPQLFESYQVIGTVKKDVAKKLGLSEQTLVVAGAGDNAAAAIGTGTVAEGRCNISLGTSGTVFISSGDRFALPGNALHSFCHADGGFHLMACILSAASCNKWFAEDILNCADHDMLQGEITNDMLGNDHVFFLPYLMGERSPINDTDARGTFIGMRMDTKRRDMVQAVLEGVAFAIRDNIELAKQQGITIESSSLCGGGARSALWQRIISNVLDITITLPVTEQGPGYGGAMLAMVGSGLFDSVSQCAEALIKVKSTVVPEHRIVERYNAQYQKFKQIYPGIKDVFKIIK